MPKEKRQMPRVFHKTTRFEEADAWDIAQHRAMTPEERMRAATVLKKRHWPGEHPDVREWERKK